MGKRLRQMREPGFSPTPALALFRDPHVEPRDLTHPAREATLASIHDAQVVELAGEWFAVERVGDDDLALECLGGSISASA